jgi:hypothetical protein
MKSAIKLTAPKTLAEHITLNLAAVDYDDAEECGDRKPWLIKRKAFAHEKEIRLYCDVPFNFQSQFAFEIDLSKLIDEIVITPFVKDWQLLGIKAAIESFLKDVGASQIAVRPSKHMRAPEIVWPPDAKPKTFGEGFAQLMYSLPPSGDH